MKKRFTLIELIVAMAMVFILLAMLYPAFQANSQKRSHPVCPYCGK